MKAEKQIIIDDLLNKLNSSPFVLIVDYTGLTVDHFSELRTRLAETGSECHVTKNAYVKRAASAAEMPEELNAFLTGQTALVTGENDVAAAAKVVKNFHAEFSKPALRAGFLDGTVLDEEAVKVLADLPSREELYAKFLGLLNQPATMLVRILNEPAAALARVIKAKEEQG